MGEVTEQEKGMVFCQASDVGKIPQLVADILHRYSCWYFASDENKCYADAAVVQMPAVGLALGGHLWRWGYSHGANPPLMAWWREAGEVAVLQALASGRAGLLPLGLVRRLEQAGTTTTQHLCTIHFAVDAVAVVALLFPAAAVGKLQPTVVTRLPNTYELLTSGSCSTERADASETIDLVDAGGSVGAGGRLTFVYVDSAVRSSKTRSAFTSKPVHSVHTDTAIVARMRVAVVCILATSGAFPALLADAGEGVSSSHTGPTVGTRTGGACAVLGCVAGVASPPGWAGAAEGVSMVVAGASVTAGGCVTLALTGMAGLALPLVGALAVEVVHQVDAVPAVLTGVVSALVDVVVAQSSLPAVRTEALEGVDQVDAGPSVSTGVTDAVVYILVTVDATEARVAHAGEVAGRFADAASSRAADVGGDVSHAGRIVGRHGNGAAVDRLTRRRLAALFEPLAGFPLVAFGTGAVEVLVDAVTLGLVLTRVGIAGV